MVRRYGAGPPLHAARLALELVLTPVGIGRIVAPRALEDNLGAVLQARRV